MKRTPRDYQSRCITAIRDAFKAGKKGVCAELFTGAGKAFILASIAEMVRAKNGRVLCLVNRDNLCQQLFQSLCDQGLHPTMERGADKASPMSDLVVGSIQTMQGDRLKKWGPNHFKMVITDEVHFGAAKTFKATLSHFASAFHLGITATIERHDKKGLWEGYQDVVFSMPLTEGIEEGWLVPLTFKELPVPITITDRENTAKKWNEAEEEAVFSRDSYLPRLFAEAAKEAQGRKALMFWPGCKASEEATIAFSAAGIESRHVDGYMAKTLIAEILEWFAAPGAKTLHNADLLSYGYDNPSIDCIGIMRLSRSVPMLKQRIGRGTRTFQADVDSYPTRELRKASIASSPKSSCLILDLMLQLGEAQSSFATSGELITADKEEAEYIRKERKAGVQIDLEEMKKLAKAHSVDKQKQLDALAEAAANAAERRKETAHGSVYIEDIRKLYKPEHKPASHAFLKYVSRMGVDLSNGPWSAFQLIRIKERIEGMKQKLLA